jgi:hypothetical protein
MASPNVLRAINPRHNPTQETLNRLLRPFKLRRTPRKQRTTHCGVRPLGLIEAP